MDQQSGEIIAKRVPLRKKTRQGGGGDDVKAVLGGRGRTGKSDRAKGSKEDNEDGEGGSTLVSGPS